MAEEEFIEIQLSAVDDWPHYLSCFPIKKGESMINQVFTIFCVCDELVQAFEIKDDPQCKMSASEVMKFALTSALYYGCD